MLQFLAGTTEVDILDPGDVADTLRDAVTKLVDAAVARIPLLLLATAVLVIGLLVVSLLHRGIVRATSGPRLDVAVARLVQVLARVVLVLIALLLALNVAGVNVGSALAALGIAGLALAFAVQSILENFIAGILILVRRPFRPGDQVQLGEWRGTVQDVNLRVTKLVDFDGELVLLPNNGVFGSPIVNLTQLGSRRTTVRVGIDYRDDHDAAREVLRAAAASVEAVLDEPPVDVLCVELGDSSVQFDVRFWTRPQQAVVAAATDQVLRACKTAVEGAGMTIPWPIRTLVVDPTSASLLQPVRSPPPAG